MAVFFVLGPEAASLQVDTRVYPIRRRLNFSIYLGMLFQKI